MNKETYNFFSHKNWSIWNKPLDHTAYVFTYKHPMAQEYNKFWRRPSEWVYDKEDFRGMLLTNTTDNEFYIGVNNRNILDTDIYTFNSLSGAMEFICDTINPKQLNGTIEIHEFDILIIKQFGIGGLGLPITPTISICQESLNIIHCDDFTSSAFNYDILKGIKRYCNNFLTEKLLSYKNFN